MGILLALHVFHKQEECMIDAPLILLEACFFSVEIQKFQDVLHYFKCHAINI